MSESPNVESLAFDVATSFLDHRSDDDYVLSDACDSAAALERLIRAVVREELAGIHGPKDCPSCLRPATVKDDTCRACDYRTR